jgi:hypothetical protein
MAKERPYQIHDWSQYKGQAYREEIAKWKEKDWELASLIIHLITFFRHGRARFTFCGKSFLDGFSPTFDKFSKKVRLKYLNTIRIAVDVERRHRVPKQYVVEEESE